MLDVVSGLPDIEVFADAHDRGEPVTERGSGFRSDQSVVFVVIGAPLGMADNDEGATQLRQECATDFAGVSARVVLRHVLSAIGQPQLVTIDQGLDATQVGEGRDDSDIDLVEVFIG